MNEWAIPIVQTISLILVLTLDHASIFLTNMGSEIMQVTGTHETF